MVLTKEQINELKQQLLEQIKHLPPDKKAEAQKQIDSMSADSLEAMLESQRSSSQNQKIFRMIIEGSIPSVKIDESPSNLAVLSVKSISRGHTIIIPKSPVSTEKELSKEIHSFSEKISEKILDSLKPKSCSILTEKAFGEMILHIIPIYDKHLDLNSPRADFTVEQLEEIKKQINIEKISKKVEKIKIKKKPAKSEVLKLPRRIP